MGISSTNRKIRKMYDYKNDAIPMIAIPYGVRYITINFDNEGSYINSRLVKEMTGGDMINARELESEYIPYPIHYVENTGYRNYTILSNSNDNSLWKRGVPVKYESLDDYKNLKNEYNKRNYSDDIGENNSKKIHYDIALKEESKESKEPYDVIKNEYNKRERTV